MYWTNAAALWDHINASSEANRRDYERDKRKWLKSFNVGATEKQRGYRTMFSKLAPRHKRYQNWKHQPVKKRLKTWSASIIKPFYNAKTGYHHHADGDKTWIGTPSERWDMAEEYEKKKYEAQLGEVKTPRLGYFRK